MEYLFFVVCLTAAVTDFLWSRIPNIWLGSWFLTGLLLTGQEIQPVLPAVAYLFRAAAVYLLLYPFWKLRMLGAGDVKLCSIMAAFLGVQAFAGCVFNSLLVGSILSFFYLVFTKSFWQRLLIFLAWFRQCISCNRWLPYRKAEDMEGTIPFAPVLLAGYLLWLLL